MLHLFVTPDELQGDTLIITGEQFNHMKNVLRMKVGEEFSAMNGADEKEYRYGIETITDDAITARLRFVKEANNELPVKVTIYQGLPKADKMDLICQKCVELGACRIVPVAMARSVVKLDAQRGARKKDRWQKIAEAAAMQSRRGIVPEVSLPMTMEEAVADAKKTCTVGLLPYELQKDDGSTKGILESLTPGQSLAIFIGPEGGFEEKEVEMAKKAGIRPISLGKRILRTESAAMVVLSWLIYLFEVS